MNILIALCVSACLCEANPPSAPENNPAAWIAVLRDYERQHGRDAWSYQELSDARSAVLDPYYNIVKTQPDWLSTLTLLYLRYYPAVFLLLFLCCCRLAWQYTIDKQCGKALCVCLLWFLTMWMALLPMEAETQPAAVVKYQGTMLREGNGMSYPRVIREQAGISLAAGVEGRLLAERDNGWVQLQLSDGTVGWVPTETVYLAR